MVLLGSHFPRIHTTCVDPYSNKWDAARALLYVNILAVACDSKSCLSCADIFFSMIMPILVHSFCYTRILSVLRKRTRIVHSEDGITSTTQMRKTSGTEARPTTEGGVRHLHIEVFHSRDQTHVTAGGESILGVKLCNSCSGSGRQVIEPSC